MYPFGPIVEEKMDNLGDDQIIVLLEGDISDLDIEFSDDENDVQVNNIDYPSVDWNVDFNASLGDNFENNNDFERNENQLSFEHILPQEQSYFSSDDDSEVPLSVRYNKYRKSLPKWIKKDIDFVHTDFDDCFTRNEDDLTQYNYFKKFIDSKILEEMVYHTNLYSTQKTGSSINTTVLEMETFIGIHIYSGIVKMPSYRMYWSDSTRFDVIANAMSRNRFEKLRNNFHLNDNQNLFPRDHINYDKLFKIRPFIDAFRKNCLLTEPEEFNSIDEFIIPFKGRSNLKQYNKNKPHKWGFKGFARCGGSGIMYDFQIYTGKNTTTKSELGISGDIVKTLVENVPKHKNYKVIFDKWFSSYKLVRELKDDGIYTLGTIRSNRVSGCNLQNDKVMKNNGRGSHDYLTDANSNIIFLKWFDNKPVHLISSYVGVEPMDMVKRWSVKDKKHIQVDRPAIVKEYNEHMGGVDLMDMLVELYRIDIKAKRYYLRIIFHLIDIAVVNSWLLYRRHCSIKKTKYIPLLDFRSQIALALIQSGKTPTRKRGRPSEGNKLPTIKTPRIQRPVDDVRYDQIGHMPVPIDEKQRCKHCITSKIRFKCIKCNLPLCINKNKNCFIDFHSK